MSDPKVGSRVIVFDLNHTSLGLGTYVRDVPLKDILEDDTEEDNNEPDEVNPELSDAIDRMVESGSTTPEILLDSGTTIYGFQCWWDVAEEDNSSVH